MKDYSWILVLAFAILTACVCVQGWFIRDLRESVREQTKVVNQLQENQKSIITVLDNSHLIKKGND